MSEEIYKEWHYDRCPKEELILENGQQILCEGRIDKFESVVIYVHSDEISKHNRPHIHAKYKDYEYQISIDDNIELLDYNGKGKCGKYIIRQILNAERIQLYRKAWNEIQSNYKFKLENGKYVCK